MSSLAAARADNFYFPPEWDPSKGSLNKFQGSHGALGDRARKLHQGILIIRFEMPYNVWCSNCRHLIGKGVRFNAEKKQIGMYLSTKIWSFSFKTPCCQSQVEIHTDPKNAEYIIVKGAQRKIEHYDAESAGTFELDSEERKSKISDPFFKLEHLDEDKIRAQQAHKRISSLRQDSEAKHREDYEMNKLLRQSLRTRKKEERTSDDHRKQLGLPDHIQLLPSIPSDCLQASAVQFGGQKFKQNWQHARRSIASSSIFTPKAIAAATVGKAANHTGLKRQRLDVGVRLKLSEPRRQKK